VVPVAILWFSGWQEGKMDTPRAVDRDGVPARPCRRIEQDIKLRATPSLSLFISKCARILHKAKREEIKKRVRAAGAEGFI
jgi:hypothetical protein